MSAVHTVTLPPIADDGTHQIKLWNHRATNHAEWQCTTHARTGVVVGFEDSVTTAQDAAWACREALIDHVLAMRASP